MTQAPTMPARGSIHSQPNRRASARPTMTRNDTAASATTWMMAARILVVPVRRAVSVMLVLLEARIHLPVELIEEEGPDQRARRTSERNPALALPRTPTTSPPL